MRQKIKNRKGFTMAEVLIVVAILGILAGIAFVSVTKYQRNLRLMEMNSIAKDIFVTSQNHLSEAQASGKIKLDEYTAITGNKAKETDESNLRILTSAGGVTSLNVEDSNDYATILVPPNSVESYVKKGYFTIRFDPVTATVLEVFYSDNYDISSVSYSELESKKDDPEGRKRFNGNGIVGYFGDTNGLDKRPVLASPKLIVHNEEVLYLEIIPSKDFASHFSYDSHSGTEAVIHIQNSDKSLLNDITFNADVSNSKVTNNRLYVVLDDVTSDSTRIKSQLASMSNMIGEDIVVHVEISDSERFGNHAFSSEVKVNSLFGGIDDTGKLSIENFRHLINLGFGSGFTSESAVTAVQKDNMDWKKFSDTVSVIRSKVITESAEGASLHYIPCKIEYDLTYEGNKLYIDSIEEILNENAGIFGEVTGAITVSDLELRNIAFTSKTEDAGALIGKVNIDTDSVINISDVIAYNTKKTTDAGKPLEIVATTKSAGGLIGAITGGEKDNTTIKNCVASVYVKGNNAAGGLIGSILSGNIKNCYTGGHTKEGVYLTNDSTDEGRPNVVATTSAGGLVGITGEGESVVIDKCYATCSVKAENADPLSNGGKFTNSTGFGWICKDEYEDPDDKYPDVSKTDYFFEGKTSNATTYDETLKGQKYPFKTIYEADSSVSSWFLKEHVGDWNITGPVSQVVNIPG